MYYWLCTTYVLHVQLYRVKNKEYPVRGYLHKISFWAKWKIFNLVSCQSLITVYMKYPKMKLIAAVWQKWNFIWGDKCHVSTTVTQNEIIRKETSMPSQIFQKNKHSRSKDKSKREIYFTSPALKTNVNRTSFKVKRNFISGFM